jgi:2-polyprenyl-6-methoxyphenol hydroxylase-like FAD-dependent oxidoreductase
MPHDIDVLIVGDGPTGLMMACQLQRRGISVRIVDRQVDRSKESRAFGVQAKTMEIFQNLGIAEKFLAVAQPRARGVFFFNGEQRAVADLSVLGQFHTPFPQLYFIPQSHTERILEEYLMENGGAVERQVELTDFRETEDGVVCYLHHLVSDKREDVRCKYILGCDGARSFVRDHLGIKFEGGVYEQQFILADAVVEWPYGHEDFMFFFSPVGFFLHARIDGARSRLMGAKFGPMPPTNPPPLEEIEDLASSVTGQSVKLMDCAWRSRFSLYHRAVKDYRKGRAFLAGDSAHIHTPVGAQGMNTGLQDATNLGWKLAWVIKGAAPEDLLDTYQAERHRIGKILLETTDRVFAMITAKGPIATKLRNFLVPIVFPILFNFEFLRRRLFRFMSQLAIHYHPNEFSYQKEEKTEGASGAGCRAPDAPTEHGQLFELLKGAYAHVLVFGFLWPDEAEGLEKTYKDYVRLHSFSQSPANAELFRRYGVTGEAIYFIRPDGYIGFRSFGGDHEGLKNYLRKLLPGCET